MLVEIDMMSEEEHDTSHEDEAPPEEFEMMDELDHLYMDEQLYLQSIFDL
tara:strand:+ start:2236 stop:2385 length:150 start_codon:yes stop_codon:yes gene_type:complete